MLDDSRYVRQAVLGRLRQAPYADATGVMATLGSSGDIVAYSDSDLVPVGMIALAPSVIVVHPSVPANSLAEFVQWTKAQGAVRTIKHSACHGGHACAFARLSYGGRSRFAHSTLARLMKADHDSIPTPRSFEELKHDCGFAADAIVTIVSPQKLRAEA